jgi:CRISPR system Cascade subunit CasD
MADYLLFRLYGPLAAWGVIAVGQERGSDTQPSKSAMIGLLAAALGIRRNQEERLAVLAAGYGFAVRVESAGVLLRDYHTAQVPSASNMKKRPHRTRRDELLIPRHDLNTVLSSREYRCDALYTVALWALPDAPYSLAALAAALMKPQFTLYLGRKSCPLSLPVQAQVVTAEHLAAALTQVSFHDEAILANNLKRDSSPTLHWEEGIEEQGLTALLTVTRRDQPLSRRRWQFRERRERRGYAEATQLPEG